MYTKEHEWVTPDGTIGITDYAQDQLGDIVFVELPAPGTKIAQMQKFGEIESVKAVSELFAPVSGEVAERNDDLENNPQWVNDSPYDDGWMLKVKLSDPGEIDKLMSADEYEAFLQAGGE
jgi:glycine cleavage system H protein